MEGTAIRHFPRTQLDLPVELRAGDKEFLVRTVGNVSAGGMFVPVGELPVGTPVHVRVANGLSFEADGVVRYRAANGHKGVGIEFTAAKREQLDRLIADLTLKGLPAA